MIYFFFFLTGGKNINKKMFKVFLCYVNIYNIIITLSLITIIIRLAFLLLLLLLLFEQILYNNKFNINFNIK